MPSVYAPGPWTLVDFPLDPEWDGSTYQIMAISDSGGQLYFEMDTQYLEREEAYATGLLVAAAPDLLESAAALLAMLSVWIPLPNEDNEDYLYVWEAAEKVQQAIQKAKGA